MTIDKDCCIRCLSGERGPNELFWSIDALDPVPMQVFQMQQGFLFVWSFTRASRRRLYVGCPKKLFCPVMMEAQMWVSSCAAWYDVLIDVHAGHCWQETATPVASISAKVHIKNLHTYATCSQCWQWRSWSSPLAQSLRLGWSSRDQSWYSKASNQKLESIYIITRTSGLLK